MNSPLKKHQLYKIVDKAGAEIDSPFRNFNQAMKKLMLLRQSGRKNIIILDAATVALKRQTKKN